MPTRHETPTPARARLFDAIRRFTFDAPDGKANGPTEQAIDDMGATMSKFRSAKFGNEELDALVAELADCASRWCGHSAEDVAELLEAAEACFPVDFKGEPASSLRRSVELGPELFRFHSKTDWVNKGRSWYASSGVLLPDTIALDAVGRVVRSGEQFRIAEEEEAYPVTVYALNRAALKRGAPS